MRILRASDYRVMPWKNGAGTTTEIAVSPEGAGLETFDWRVSMARVETDGPFSAFPGVDRTLAVLEGEGMILNVAGRIPFGLTEASQPLLFPADAQTHADLISGPITDLNVMSRRGLMSHSVERMEISGTVDLTVSGDATLIFCHRGCVRVSGEEQFVLGSLDTLWMEDERLDIVLSSDRPATVFIIQIDAAGRVD